MKKLLAAYTALALFFSATPVAAETSNSNATDLERTSTQYWSITDGSQTGLDFTGDLTFSAWVKFESTAGGELRPIIGKRNSTGNQRGYLWYLIVTNTIAFQKSDNGTNIHEVSVSWTPSTAVWYHVAVSKSGTSVKFFVNGSQQGTTQTLTNSTILNSTATYNIGNFPDSGGDSFDGIIDGVLVYNAALADATIAALYTNPCNPSATSLVSSWLFNGNGNDSTGSNNLTANGSAAASSTDVPYSCTAAASTPDDGRVFFE